MKKRKFILSLLLAGVLPVAMAAAPKTYQATGPVLSVTDNAIVVQKDSEKWEIARDKDTNITAFHLPECVYRDFPLDHFLKRGRRFLSNSR